jgi:hypothetical protein
LLSFGAESVFSQFANQNLKIKIYGTIYCNVVLYGHDTWSLTLREDCRLRMLKNRVLRRMFGPKRNEIPGKRGKLMSNLMICTPYQILLG